MPEERKINHCPTCGRPFSLVRGARVPFAICQHCPGSPPYPASFASPEIAYHPAVATEAEIEAKKKRDATRGQPWESHADDDAWGNVVCHIDAIAKAAGVKPADITQLATVARELRRAARQEGWEATTAFNKAAGELPPAQTHIATLEHGRLEYLQVELMKLRPVHEQALNELSHAQRRFADVQSRIDDCLTKISEVLRPTLKPSSTP
jgi:hypothetical protein